MPRLCHAQSNIPAREQSITFEGRELSNPKATMQELGVVDHAVLLLRRKVNTAGQYVYSSIHSPTLLLMGMFRPGPAAQDSEMMRLQLLGDPHLMRQLREVRSSMFIIPPSATDTTWSLICS